MSAVNMQVRHTPFSFERSTVGVPGRTGGLDDLAGLKRIWQAPTIPAAGLRSENTCCSSRCTCIDHVVSPSSCRPVETRLGHRSTQQTRARLPGQLYDPWISEDESNVGSGWLATG